MDEPRKTPYVWPTWITGHISGERHCEWAPWYKAHFRYAKVEDTGGNALLTWKADHAAAVQQVVAAARKDWPEVRVEQQNKFSVTGKSGATIGGVPDVVLVGDDEAVIIDCKTGKQRESDYWQVVLYGVMLPLQFPELQPLAISGRVFYRESHREVTEGDIQVGRPHVFEAIRKVAQADPPPRTPSRSECRFCDILNCQDRVKEMTESQPVKTSADF